MSLYIIGKHNMSIQDLNEWRKNNPEKVKTNVKKYYLKNKEKINKYTTQYKREHKEKMRVYGLKHRIKNKDKIKISQNRWLSSEKGKLIRKKYNKYYNKTPKLKFYKYKYGASKRGLIFDLTFKEFMNFWNKECFYCNTLIQGIGLDRVDNSKGYLKDNVVSCCETCNRIKINHNLDVWLKHLNKIVQNMNKKDKI